MIHVAVKTLSDLADTFLEKYSPGEPCPACGGKYNEDPECVLWCKHAEDCSLKAAVILINEEYAKEIK